MTSDDALDGWCRAQLGAGIGVVVERTGHLSDVIVVELVDRRRVVVKVRSRSPRVEACSAVQRTLHAAGFPCAAVLAGPASIGDRVATAEAYVASHGPPPSPPPVEPTAALLAELIRVAPPAVDHPGLEPAPPWVGWDHRAGELWPWPDDLDVDLNAHPGPAWLDGLARSIRTALADDQRGPVVIGHADWEAHNLDWHRGQPVLVHDWDSLAIRTEAGLVGAAATVYPSHGPVVAATVEQTAAFLDAYARCRPWGADRERTAWAAGLWVLAYNAKKETLGGGTGYLAQLDAEGDERLGHAAV